MPAFKLGDAAGLVDNVMARLQVQVVRVGQDRLRTGEPNLFRAQRFHRRFCGHRDKRRGINRAMRGGDRARAALHSRQVQVGVDGETQIGHSR